MQMNQTRPQPFDILLQAIAYIIGGIFLYTAKVDENPILGAQVIGGVFIVFAYFLVTASLFNKLITWARKVDMYLLLGLFIAMVTRLAIAGVEAPELYYVIVPFLIYVVGSLLFHIVKQTKELAKNLRGKNAAIRILRVLAFVFSLFAFFMVLMKISLHGGPVLWLALSVVFISISLLLRDS